VNARMAVYATGDIVSNIIRRDRGWESTRTHEILQHLSARGKSVLLDIGANIGWFPLVAAYSGYEVVAVEPFEENRQLLQRTLCMAPEAVRRRVKIVPYALGPSGISENTTCELWQAPNINRGDTVTTCSVGAGSSNADFIKQGFSKLATTQLRSLDSLLPSLPLWPRTISS